MTAIEDYLQSEMAGTADLVLNPNGPLVYDMMVNRSPRWRAKNLRPNILPPGWKMGISRLGRVPVYDALYEPISPQRVPEARGQAMAVIRRHGIAGVSPRYQASGPQFDFATDEYNLGLPHHLAQLYHDNIRRRDGGGVSLRSTSPFNPPGMSGRGTVPIVVDDLPDKDFLDEGSVDPRVNTLQRPQIRKNVSFPPYGVHRPDHHPRHGSGHDHSHEMFHANHLERDIRISNHAQQMDRRNAELEQGVDLEIAEQRRRAEHAHLRRERIARHEEHARLEEEEIRRREEEGSSTREEELQATEAELIAGNRHREHHESQKHWQEHGHGHGHGHRDTCRVVRDRDGRAVIVGDHQSHHRELIRVPEHDPPRPPHAHQHHSPRHHLSVAGQARQARHVHFTDALDSSEEGRIAHHRKLVRVPEHDPHHPHLGHQHHSPPCHNPSVARQARQARHVHFADALDSSDEERIAHDHERLRHEACPLSRRRRFDRERSPYHYLEDDLRKFASDKFYEPCQRLLMPPRSVRGNWWDDAELGSGDDD